jgi:type I restriction enzyme S subunit
MTMPVREDVPNILLQKKVATMSDKVQFLERELRLDAPYYSSQFLVAKNFVEESQYEKVPLIELCDDIFRLSQFKRIWSDEAHGTPYMASTDLIYFKPFRSRENLDKAFVAKGKHADMAKIMSVLGKKSPTLAKKGEERFFLEEGWILVTCSGSLGRVVLATKSLTKFFFSHDLIRIVPKKETLNGYLYAYLNSWIGQTFLGRDQYGGWIKHIEPKQIRDIPVILPPREVQIEIHKKMIDGYTFLEEFRKREIESINSLDSLFMKKSK